jgi:hypothetical protein
MLKVALDKTHGRVEEAAKILGISRHLDVIAPAARSCVSSAPRSNPFGGSGTTALSCQFLVIRPSAIEVNPTLA